VLYAELGVLNPEPVKEKATLVAELGAGLVRDGGKFLRKSR